MENTITITTQGMPEVADVDIDACSSIRRGGNVTVRFVSAGEDGSLVDVKSFGFGRLTRRRLFWLRHKKFVWPLYWRWHWLWRRIRHNTIDRIRPRTASWWNGHPIPAKRRGSSFYRTDG